MLILLLHKLRAPSHLLTTTYHQPSSHFFSNIYRSKHTLKAFAILKWATEGNIQYQINIQVSGQRLAFP